MNRSEVAGSVPIIEYYIVILFNNDSGEKLGFFQQRSWRQNRSAFDGIAVFHPLLEGVGGLLPAPPLQIAVILPDVDRPVLLLGPDTLRAQRALRAMITPLEPIAHVATLLFL